MAHLNGPLDIGQIAVACALGYVDLRFDPRGWRNGNDGLADWFRKIETRPSLAETRPATG